MHCVRRLLPTRTGRRGFTLIELMVSMAITAIVLYMALGSLAVGMQIGKRGSERNDVRQSLSLVMDQMTKELRECVTRVDNEGAGIPDSEHPELRIWPVGTANVYGVTVPAWRNDRTTQRGLEKVKNSDGTWNQDMSVLNSSYSGFPPLGANQSYVFKTLESTRYVLEFFTRDSTGVKHRIRYRLGLPSAGGSSRSLWASPLYQPCEILYSNEKWNVTTSQWSGVSDQPMTDQIVTRFTVIRPQYSDKVIQIVLEAYQRNTSGAGASPIRLVGEVSLRQ